MPRQGVVAKGNSDVANLKQTDTFARKLYISMLTAPDPVTGQSMVDRANERLRALYENDLYKYSTTFLQKTRSVLADPTIATVSEFKKKTRRGDEITIKKTPYFRATKDGTLAQLKLRYQEVEAFLNNRYLDPTHVQTRLEVDAKRFGLTESQYKFMIEFFTDEDLKIKDYDSDSLMTSVSEYIQNSNIGRIKDTFDALTEIYNKRVETSKKLNVDFAYASPKDFFIDELRNKTPERLDRITTKYINEQMK